MAVPPRHSTPHCLHSVDNDVGGMLMAGFVIGVGYVVCDHILAVTLLTVGYACDGLTGVGPVISTLDMSPQYSGLYGLY